MSDRLTFPRGAGGGPGHGTGSGQGEGGSGHPQDFGLSAWDDTTEQKQPRDWKKTFLVAGLAILSWVATYVGMLELIEANMGNLPILHKIIIGFSVAMLMTMVVWLLDQIFQPHNFLTKLAYVGGYLFLTIISVGFGFGFYWKVLESRGEGTRGAETASAQVQAPLQTAAARLESLQTTLVRLQEMSQSKAEIERTSGTSCPNSRPGDGPRRKLRDDDAGRFAFASDFVKGRIGQVKGDMAAIDGELAKIVADDKSILDKNGTRNEFMKSMSRRLDSTVTNFNAFRGDPQLKQIRTELAERAEKSSFTDTLGKLYSCPDQQLSTMIRSVVASIDALPVLDKPKITTVEGSDATIEAFRRLTATFYGLLSFKLPPSSDELRELQKRAVTQAEQTAGGRPPVMAMEQVGQGGLSKRDYVPLAIAIFVDLCLLLVSMGKGRSRLQGLVPKMKEAERGPVIQILSRFNEIHRDRQIRENFEIFRHVVFDFNGDYYAAIPLIAPYSVDRRRPNAYGPADIEALQQEAHLLGNFFTSFENDRLFSRVMMPLIPTSRIQKKLWAQGSKFAHAEAFRLYKFKDGAWQEMILGAIMGAAKRVDSEKRSRRIENDVFTRHTPGFVRETMEAPDLRGTDLQAHMASAAAMAAIARDAARAQSFDPQGRTQGFAPNVPRPGNRPVAPPPPPAPDSAKRGFRRHPPVSRQSTVADNTFDDAFGEPVADDWRTESQVASQGQHQAASPVIRPANGNTATPSATPKSEERLPATTPTVALEPDAGHDTVEVEAKERSIKYRMPRGDLPVSLKAALEANTPSALAELPVSLPPPVEQNGDLLSDLPGIQEDPQIHSDHPEVQAAGQTDMPIPVEADELPQWSADHVSEDMRDAALDVESITRRFGLNRQRA